MEAHFNPRVYLYILRHLCYKNMCKNEIIVDQIFYINIYNGSQPTGALASPRVTIMDVMQLMTENVLKDIMESYQFCSNL